LTGAIYGSTHDGAGDEVDGRDGLDGAAIDRAQGSVPGNRGIWVGILCELSEFALMFLAYAWFKYTHPEDFHRGPAMLYTACGVANTVTMLTSGYFAVRALLAIQRNDRRSARNWLIGTLLGGLAFLASRPGSSAGTSTTASSAPATASWPCTTTSPSITWCMWCGAAWA
jgi:cytochrome c oxidase subunit 3